MPIINKLYKLPELRARKPVEIMISNYELLLNPDRYTLSEEAKKRLKWMYIIEYETPKKKIAKAARQIGVSRQWISTIHSLWIKNNKNPQFLEPQSKAPHNTDNRERISSDTKDKIIQLRNKRPTWGRDKLKSRMKSLHNIKVGASTINRYLSKHNLLNVRLSQKNKLAFKNKVLNQRIKQRPPKAIKDLKPGALVEKDMKYIVKLGRFTNPDKPKAKENFFYQHTMIDDFTRIRVLDTVADANSLTAKQSFQKSKSRFPFPVACINTDSGGENGKEFAEQLTQENIIQFFSRIGTPTDNPRVERSHLTDELEFYGQGNVYETLTKQQQAQQEWERIYNYDRPHQALGQLTPMEFYELWKKDPDSAYAIKDKYQEYLKKQAKRLRDARRMKKKEQIEALMQHIDSVLTPKTVIKKCQ
jgi:transposase InsO family protein